MTCIDSLKTEFSLLDLIWDYAAKGSKSHTSLLIDSWAKEPKVQVKATRVVV